MPRNVLNQLGQIVTSIDTDSEDDVSAPASETDQDTFSTENTPGFVGVVSQSQKQIGDRLLRHRKSFEMGFHTVFSRFGNKRCPGTKQHEYQPPDCQYPRPGFRFFRLTFPVSQMTFSLPSVAITRKICKMDFKTLRTDN